MNAPILALRRIAKRFAGVPALRDVDFEIREREVVALIGENGAGKSTLMKVMGGLHQADAGEIELDGQPAKIASPAAAARRGITLIHQELSNLDNLDVASNIFLGREPTRLGPLRWVDGREMRRRARGILERIGLDVSPSTPMVRLSIAQQQMVEIARALAVESRIVIMDEPTSSLTLVETERLLEIVRELKDHGCSVVYVSHRLNEITACADRVVGLRDGQNSGELRRDEISHDAMVRLMVGRSLARPTPQSASERGNATECLKVEGWVTPEHPTHRISFEIREGEILGLGGLIGAGRTELATTLAGISRCRQGTITLRRRKLCLRSARDAIRHGIYLVPEDRRRCGLVTAMTVRENITLPALPRFARAGLVRRAREKAAAETQRARLSIRTASLETLARNLSGGNQQKIVLAKWLLLNPQCLIFDEPTRGIDVGSKAEIYRLMRDLVRRGVFVLMISSDMEELLGVSDRILVMREGVLVGAVERKDFSEETIMRMAVAAPKTTL